MRRVALLVVAALLASPAAHAAPAEKDPAVARGIALGGWVASLAMIGLGAAIVDDDDTDEVGGALALGGIGLAVAAPSFGHVYAEEYGHAAIGSGARAGGVLLLGYGYARFFNDDGGTELMVVGVAAYLAATVYDLVDAPRAARRANRRAAIVPVVPARGGLAPGLSLVGAF